MLEVLCTHESNEEALTKLSAQSLRHRLGTKWVGLGRSCLRRATPRAPRPRGGGRPERPGGRGLVLEEAEGHRQLAVGDLLAPQQRRRLEPAPDRVEAVHDGEGDLVVLQVLQLSQQVVYASPDLGPFWCLGLTLTCTSCCCADKVQNLLEVLGAVPAESAASITKHREGELHADLRDLAVLEDEAHEVKDDAAREQAKTKEKRAEGDAAPCNACILPRGLPLSLRRGEAPAQPLAGLEQSRCPKSRPKQQVRRRGQGHVAAEHEDRDVGVPHRGREQDPQQGVRCGR
mmetsp:Transcript_18598/g.52528  ORF Transcript_18598/g.52528 Transcript_18598/m.52528 type:complete len:288 (-) Transcript_18598:7-870(-)